MTRRRLRLLDLCCGAGGASAGYHAAGFDVVGVDIHPQPDYPYPFIHADALDVDPTGYDVVHASPPCQRWCTATPANRRGQHPDLIAPFRQRLQTAVTTLGGPLAYVIENVPGAPLHHPATICGDTLRLGVRRHRLFESNMPLAGTPCWHDRSTPATAVYGSYGQRARRTPDQPTPSTQDARHAMGINWMPWPALTQAIPPAYTFWIGVQLHAQLCRGAFVTPVNGQTSPAPARSVTPTSQVQVPSVTPDAVSPAGFRHCRNPRCGKPLTHRPATGRWPRYCSHACRQAAYRTRHQQETP